MDKKKKILMYIVYSIIFVISLIYLFIMYFLNKKDKIKVFNQISLSVQLIVLLIIYVYLWTSGCDALEYSIPFIIMFVILFIYTITRVLSKKYSTYSLLVITGILFLITIISNLVINYKSNQIENFSTVPMGIENIRAENQYVYKNIKDDDPDPQIQEQINKANKCCSKVDRLMEKMKKEEELRKQNKPIQQGICKEGKGTISGYVFLNNQQCCPASCKPKKPKINIKPKYGKKHKTKPCQKLDKLDDYCKKKYGEDYGYIQNKNIKNKLSNLNKIYFDTKIQGNDLVKPIKNISNFAECKMKCNKNNKCLYYSYDKKNKKCFLKKNIGKNLNNNDFISGSINKPNRICINENEIKCKKGYFNGKKIPKGSFYTPCVNMGENLNQICKNIALQNGSKLFSKYGVEKFIKCKSGRRALCSPYYVDEIKTHPINSTKCFNENEKQQIYNWCVYKKGPNYRPVAIKKYDCPLGKVRGVCITQNEFNVLQDRKYFYQDSYF